MKAKSKAGNNHRRLYRPFFFLFMSLSSIVCFSISLPEKNENRINLLLITVDTLRPDRLSCYSRSHLKTPNIDGLAEKGILFSKAFASTPTTLPSHANILLGTTPLYHGVHANSNNVVRDELLTLSEYLKDCGYSTGAFVGGYPLDSRFGLGQGFDIYDDDFAGPGVKKPSVLERSAGEVVEKALNWLTNIESPWFLWIHCFDPHDPYEPPEPYKTQYKDDLYSGEVAYVDTVMGKLFDHMREKKYFGNTLIIFTGDHGESLGEHGELTHGYFAYNSTIWVPLIIVLPGGNPGRIGQDVSHIDIFPTICDVLLITKPPFLQGISLIPAIEGKDLKKRQIYFESLDPYFSQGWAPLKGFLYRGEKFMESPLPELYDLEDDFDELNNLAEKRELDGYKKQLSQIAAAFSSPEDTKKAGNIDRESLEKLRSLGYLSTSSPRDQRKEFFGPQDDIKVLMPYYNRAVEARELFKRGKTNDALGLLNDIIRERKDFAIAYWGLALMYRQLGKLHDSLAILKLGLERVPSNYDIFFNYISDNLAAGHYDEIIKLVSEKRYPAMESDAAIWLNLGLAYSGKGDIMNAIGATEKALSLDGKNPTIYNNLGTNYYYLTLKTEDPKVFENCIANFKKAIELDPDYAAPYSGLGAAYRIANNLDGAIYCWERALKLQPDSDQALYSLGLAYFDNGETAKALDYLNKYKERYSQRLPPGEKKKLEDLIQKLRQR
jgi:arylsulfatase A-like enzyme/Flp pilus assembly protein TadD